TISRRENYFCKQGFTRFCLLRIIRAVNKTSLRRGTDRFSIAEMYERHAQVVKLVDTLASGASGLTAVEVRVFSWAPIPTKPSLCSALLFLAVALSLNVFLHPRISPWEHSPARSTS